MNAFLEKRKPNFTGRVKPARSLARSQASKQLMKVLAGRERAMAYFRAAQLASPHHYASFLDSPPWDLLVGRSASVLVNLLFLTAVGPAKLVETDARHLTRASSSQLLERYLAHATR